MITLAECTHLEAARLARDPRSVILLPLGAVEEHGPHLPLLVDWLGAEELARRIAPHLSRAGFQVVLAPSLPYGVSALADDWAGTVSLSRQLVTRLIVEVVRALARPGFRRFVLVNYQADPEHLRAMAAARSRLVQRRDLRIIPFRDFSEIDSRENRTIQFQFRIARNVIGDGHRAGDDRDVQNFARRIFHRLVSHRGIGSAEIDGLLEQLLNARAGADGLIIELNA